MKTSPIYPHRKNKDGSYDSICLTCFQTVSHAHSEAELGPQEEAHLCAASLLSKRGDYKWQQLKAPPLQPPGLSDLAIPGQASTPSSLPRTLAA
jgi:hypothetical protein